MERWGNWEIKKGWKGGENKKGWKGGENKKGWKGWETGKESERKILKRNGRIKRNQRKGEGHEHFLWKGITLMTGKEE